jgi:hypothetical protein
MQKKMEIVKKLTIPDMLNLKYINQRIFVQGEK